MPNEKPELIEDPVGVLPTGTISMSQVNSELGRPATQGIDLNDGGVRTLAEAGAGQISMSQLRGKSASFKATFFSSEAQVSLFNWLTARGWNQVAPVEVTINGGVYIYSDNVSIPALAVNGSYPSGLKIINHGIIMGKGGSGDHSGLTHVVSEQCGGQGISIQAWNVSFASDGYVCGGGGGGNTGSPIRTQYFGGGGGGAGGGKGGDMVYLGSGVIDCYGGGGGGLGGAGASGTTSRVSDPYLAPTGGGAGGGAGTPNNYLSGAGGGRSVTNPYGGTGGYNDSIPYGGANGGSYNNVGGDHAGGNTGSCGGGGFGANGGSETQPASGVAGKAIALNGYSVNFQSYGTIWGAIN